MTSSLRLLFYFLWIVPHAVQLGIFGALMRRRLYRLFPIFTAYIGFAICYFIVLFVINWLDLSAGVYFQWYSFGLGISTALLFGITCEIFSHVFANHAALRNIQKPLFRWTAVAFLIIAFSFANYTLRSGTDPAWFSVHVLDRCANIVLCGLMLSLFLLSYWLELSWNRLVFGMALGLGILCSLELALAAIRSQVGHSAHIPLDLLDMATYNVCVLIWLYYLLVPERTPANISDKVPDSDLDLWSNELESLLGR